MSYAGLVAFGRRGLGAVPADKPGCMYFTMEVEGTTGFPAEVCPVSPGKTGHKVPQPILCGGAGSNDVHTVLGWLGLYKGSIDAAFNAGTAAGLKAVAQAHGVPYNGTADGVTPDVCKALVAEATKKVPYCTDTTAMKPQPCWKNLATGPVSAAPPSGGAAKPSGPTPTGDSWWARRSTVEKAGVIGAGVLVASGLLYLSV